MSSSQIFGLLLIAAIIFAGIYIATHKNILDSIVNGTVGSFSGLFSGSSGRPVGSGGVPGTSNNVSPYAEVIKIESVSFGSSGTDQRLFLRSYASMGQKVSISGWTIEGSAKPEIIPKVPSVYRVGGSGYATDIVLNSGDALGFFSGLSPVRENIRANKCMGYLPEAYAFTPPLGIACYTPTATELSGLSGQCRSLIATLPLCATFATTPSWLPQNDTSCRVFFEKLNYNGCVAAHENDLDFFTGDTRVWIGVPFLSYPSGFITLKDAQGRVVTTYSY